MQLRFPEAGLLTGADNQIRGCVRIRDGGRLSGTGICSTEEWLSSRSTGAWSAFTYACKSSHSVLADERMHRSGVWGIDLTSGSVHG